MVRTIQSWLVALVLLPGFRQQVLGIDETAVRRRVEAGRKHWAFQRVDRPALPPVRNPSWCRTPVDSFVLARLEADGLEPSPAAEREAWIRRVSLDLVGLPVDPARIDAFVQDRSEGAWDRIIEAFLASAHYGERWGRFWLDAARYADSNGYEKDRAREMWHYRDWVVGAFNRDLPYDRFVIEQLAGDQLPEATQEQRIATGFLRNSMINEEGAIDPEQFRMDAMFDRMDCLGKSILGLTIQCSQCHEHKYDPMSQAEYYGLFAYLNNADELTAPVYSAAELASRERILHEIRQIEAELRLAHPDWEARMARWEEAAATPGPGWVVPEWVEHGDPGGLSKLQRQPDGSLLAGGHPFTGGTWRVVGRTTLTNITAVRLEALTDGNLPMHGPGRSGRGLFALREFRLTAAPVGKADARVDVRFAGATADVEEPQAPPGSVVKDKDYSGPVAFAVDGNDRTAWTIDAGAGRRNVDRKAVFTVATNVGFAGGTELVFSLACRDEIARFRISVTTASNVVADPLPREAREALSIERGRRTPGQQQALFTAWRAQEPGFRVENERIEALWRQYPEASGTTLALASRRAMRETRILTRGDWLKPGEPIAPSVPAFLHPLPAGADGTRLTLARWLVDRRSPTTARVLVNRVWQAYFGTGLVATPEDFGLQGEAPSHAGLLDWLAAEFMEPSVPDPADGRLPARWSVKHLHRLIVRSATYRQRSVVTPGGFERDPYNRLLARGPRLRVDGESVRDIALAVSGLLDRRVGGPSVFSPAPPFLFVPPNSYGSFPWTDARGPDRYRRALYTFRRRSTPYPMLQNFDVPNGDSACVRRPRSNTPLQALTTLNEPVFVECARAFARVILTEGGAGDVERIRYAFRRVTARWPEPDELDELQGLLARQRGHLAAGWVNPSELATGEPVPAGIPPGVTPTQWAAYTVLSRVLLNLDETITKE